MMDGHTEDMHCSQFSAFEGLYFAVTLYSIGSIRREEEEEKL